MGGRGTLKEDMDCGQNRYKKEMCEIVVIYTCPSCVKVYRCVICEPFILNYSGDEDHHD